MQKKQLAPTGTEGGGQPMGTEGIKKVLMFALALTTALRDILKDKKVTFQEAITLLPQVMGLPELLQQLPEIKAEWADRSPEELQEINAFIKDNFTLTNQELEAVIEGALDVAESVVNLIDKIGDMQSKNQAAGNQAEGQQ